MEQTSVIHGPGHDPQKQGLVGSWVGVATAAAGAWAVDRFLAHQMGAWRYIPMGVLILFALVAGGITLLLTLVANETSLELTDTHLVLRGWLRKRRWAWTDLREVRVVAVAWPSAEPLNLQAENVDILTLVRVSGAMVPLPAPFRTARPTGPDDVTDSDPVNLEPIAQQLNAALRLHHPLAAEPMDDAGAGAAATALNESMASAELRRATRDKRWSTAAGPIVIVAVLIQLAHAVQENNHQSLWEYASAILFGVAVVQVFPGSRFLPRTSKRWRHIYLFASVLIGLLIAVLYGTSH